MTYVAGVDLLQVSNTQVTGVNGDLMLEDLDSLGNTLGAEDVGEHHGAADTDSLDTQSQELQGVASVADATVGVDLKLLEDLGGLLVDLNGDLERGRAVVKLAAAVVGEDDGRGAVLDGQLGVSDTGDALDDDGEGGHLLELLVVGPGKGRIVRVAKPQVSLRVAEAYKHTHAEPTP